MKRPTSDATGLAFRYAAGVTIAHILAVTEVVFIMTALGRETTGAAHRMFNGDHSGVIVTVMVVAIVVVGAGSLLNIWPSLRWFVPRQEPTPHQSRSAIGIGRRQSLLIATTWIASGDVVVLVNRDSAFAVAALMAPAVFSEPRRPSARRCCSLCGHCARSPRSSHPAWRYGIPRLACWPAS